jgi:hypothetical protein
MALDGTAKAVSVTKTMYAQERKVGQELSVEKEMAQSVKILALRKKIEFNYQ